MNSLHPTATDGCDAGLHAFVDGRCRDCGALASIANRQSPIVNVPAKRFAVTISPGDSTRWHCTPEKFSEGLEVLIGAAVKCWTSGLIPRVTVQVLPGEAVTAVAPSSAAGACAPGASVCTDPADPGAFSNNQRAEIAAKLRQAADSFKDSADLIDREARKYTETEWREFFADGSAAFFLVRQILGFNDTIHSGKGGAL